MDGGLVAQAHELSHALNGFDCVVATTSGIAFALALCKQKKLLRRPVVAIQCGLLNFPYGLLRTLFTKRYLTHLDSIFFGDGELDPVKGKFPSIGEKLGVCQYGVDIGFWQRGDEGRGEYVLSVGNDGRRDYDCLLAAAEKIPCEIKILTTRKLPKSLPGNITLLKSSWHNQHLTDKDLRKLYQKARCVALPIIETFQPSGQSVALQAMACGTPVVITDTPGFWDKESYRDGVDLLYCKGGDPEDLANKIISLLASPSLLETLARNGCSTVRKIASMEGFATCIEEHCRQFFIE